MTEQEWLASDDPVRMLEWLIAERVRPDGTAAGRRPINGSDFQVSDRKLRLFGVACVRQVWHFLEDARSHQAVEVVEQYVDELTSQAELDTAALSAGNARRESPYCPWNEQTPDQQRDMAALAACELFQPPTIAAAQNAARLTGPRDVQASLLRTIVGNPLRPVTLPTTESPKRLVQCPHCRLVGRYCYLCHGTTKVLVACEHCFDKKVIYLGMDNLKTMPCIKCPKPTCPWLTHADGRVPKMAQVIYDERAWDQMPMLADALEDAGCRDETMLGWCRGLERCPKCLGSGKDWVRSGGYAATCVCDWESNDNRVGPGWIPRRGPSVRGDWCIDLLLGKE